MAAPNQRHFIVKHDLASLEALPGVIWRTGMSADERPRNFHRIRPGDCWISFAYIDNERDRQPLSLVTGFYACTEPMSYGKLPLDKMVLKKIADGETDGWMTKGKACGNRLDQPVSVPIYRLLDKEVFYQATITPDIGAEGFKRIQEEAGARKRVLSQTLLGQEPRNEQELLATVVAARANLGIDFVSVGTAFPDLRVKLTGHTKEIALELEVCSRSFVSHGHHRKVSDGKLRDGVEVGVLCWVDDDADGRVKNCVQGRVFEVQRLLRAQQKIKW